MNQMLGSIWTKIVNNKHIIIRAAGALAGAVIGIGIANSMANSQEQPFYEEMTDPVDMDLDFSPG